METSEGVKIWWFGIAHSLVIFSFTLLTSFLTIWTRLPESFELLLKMIPIWVENVKRKTEEVQKIIMDRMKIFLTIRLPPFWLSEKRYLED